MSKYFRILLFLISSAFIAPLIFPVLAQVGGGGPAGIPLLEYTFARVVCVTVPLGYIALLVVLVIAGLKYLTSGGEAKAVQAAHQTVTWGLLGVLFLAIAWLILQLIQTFTGVEVTKFTVSSLPGVQGFSGQCFGPAPVAPEPQPQIPEPPKQAPVSPVIAPPVIIDSSGDCSESRDVFVKLRPEQVMPHFGTFFSPGSTYPYLNIYTSVENIQELERVLSEPRWVLIMVETLDNNLYELIRPNEFGGRTYFGRFEKDRYPTKFMEAISIAKRIAIELEIKQGIEFYYPISREVSVGRIKCPDADYYNIATLSPLIYLYPQSPTPITLKINSPLISPKLSLNNGYWSTVASPDGTLTTLDGNRYRFIPYEFLRNDFKRPEKGFIVEGNRLEEYLKNELWPKLGLTDKEIEDYWVDTKPRVKSSPYYFVSLIDRSEIDRVLPMEVNPKPDTILRNMTYILPLPSEPAITPVPLENEKLIAPERKGFTVLENGVFTDGF